MYNKIYSPNIKLFYLISINQFFKKLKDKT